MPTDSCSIATMAQKILPLSVWTSVPDAIQQHLPWYQLGSMPGPQAYSQFTSQPMCNCRYHPYEMPVRDNLDLQELSSQNRTQKTYSLVQSTQSWKRPRRAHHEIDRMYLCSWQGCSKGYETLNHLNTHVTTKRHGIWRHPRGRSPSDPFFSIP